VPSREGELRALRFRRRGHFRFRVADLEEIVSGRPQGAVEPEAAPASSAGCAKGEARLGRTSSAPPGGLTQKQERTFAH